MPVMLYQCREMQRLSYHIAKKTHANVDYEKSVESQCRNYASYNYLAPVAPNAKAYNNNYQRFL